MSHCIKLPITYFCDGLFYFFRGIIQQIQQNQTEYYYGIGRLLNRAEIDNVIRNSSEISWTPRLSFCRNTAPQKALRTASTRRFLRRGLATKILRDPSNLFLNCSLAG